MVDISVGEGGLVTAAYAIRGHTRGGGRDATHLTVVIEYMIAQHIVILPIITLIAVLYYTYYTIYSP